MTSTRTSPVAPSGPRVLDPEACFEKLRDHQQLSSAQRAVEAQMEVEAAEAGA